MTLFLQLFYTFFKIGLFGFGGGYAMLSMIQGEVVTKYHWLNSYEFTDIVAMSQMTPGPIGINSATYVGYTAIVNAGFPHWAGIAGSIVSTSAVVLPSFILMILISRFFLKYQQHPVIAAVFSGLRPGVVGLLAAAALVLMNHENFGTETRQVLISILLFGGTFVASYRYKMNPILLICLCGAIGLLTSCGNGANTHHTPTAEGDTLELRYARQLCLVEHEGYTEAIVRNPWKEGERLQTYLLVDKRHPLPDGLPQGTVVRVPLERSLVYSSVHLSLLDELEALPAVGGVCDASYIQLSAVTEGLRHGSVADCGSSLNPDLERIIDLRPDAVLLSPFENSGGYGRIDQLGIPLVECADYMETSPLGRAEWMRFFGRLYGKAAPADTLFAIVEREYLTLKAAAQRASDPPTVLSELKNGAAWYVPGGHSTVGQLYQDAGARYVFAHLAQAGSVALSPETVLDQAQGADLWLIKYHQSRTDKTYRELASDYAPYSRFEAFRQRRVFGCNTARTAFYEETPFHPEMLLKELVALFHPSLVPGYTARYYHPLAE